MFERIEEELRYELLAVAGRQDARELQKMLYRRLGVAAVADALEIDAATVEEAHRAEEPAGVRAAA